MTADAILFDLDDTLVPDAAAFRDAALETAGALGAGEGLVEALRRQARAAWQRGPHAAWFRLIGVSSREGLWAPARGSGPRIESIREWLRSDYRPSVWRAALTEAGADPGLAARAAADFAQRRAGSCRPFADAVRALERVRAAGLRTVVVTNGMADLQWRKLHRAGLEPYFDAFLASSAVGIGKPDPRIFEVALERLGTTPERAWMVGDHPLRDVAGAQRAGVRAAWLDRDGGHAGGHAVAVVPDATIGSLADLSW
jgi:phosphoserine phosphatase